MFEEHLSLFIRAPAAAVQDVATEWSNPVLLSPGHGYMKNKMFEEHLSLFIRAPAAAAQDVATEWSNPDV